MQITMPRGDYIKRKFIVKDKSGNIVDIDFDEIYITFKRRTDSKEALFQKRLTTGQITKDEDGYYHFGILPEDTDDLDYSKYYFDIELYNKKPLIKRTILGELTLTAEVTHAYNEGE